MNRQQRWIRPAVLAGLALVGVAPAARAQSGGVYNLTWSNLQGSGGVSAGGVYTLSGALGQPLAGPVMAGPYALSEGFWPVPPVACAADLNGDNALTISDFLLFLQYYGTADPRADFDHSGLLNIQDFLGYLQAYGLGC